MLSSNYYLPVDETQIPTGEIKSVENTMFDLTKFSSDNSSTNVNAYGTSLGSVVREIDGSGRSGYDHCFVVNNSIGNENKNQLNHVATLTDELSGRQLILHSSQPGVQVYTANWLSEDESEHPFTQHNAICLETQHFPDSVNQNSFPNVILSPGEEYNHSSVFSFRLTQ